jgi:hypothetical protein
MSARSHMVAGVLAELYVFCWRALGVVDLEGV